MSTDRGSPGANTVVYAQVTDTLEANGVDVVALGEVGGDPYLTVEVGDNHRTMLVTVALTFLKYDHIVRRMAQIVAYDADTHEEVAHAYVNRRLIDQFREGEMEKLEYASRVAKTWKERGARE